ncbi:Ig-like domain-containing protein [Paenibacillus sp. GCM10027626]|uniref:Ig-like domain-containing protein n=1 Tax=Paenibacillus sp. GCM10027626 TaxID=3273411 RepID=UPI0036377996
MWNKTRGWGMLLLSCVLLLSTSAFVQAGSGADNAAAGSKKVYRVEWTDETLTTPADWLASAYYSDPAHKETRFENYNNDAPIPPGGARETSFYMAYRADGLHMFFQSAEPDRDANGALKPSTLEMFLATGEGELPYHQVIIPTSGGDIEYYEWQTEYRHNRPLKGRMMIDSQEIPGGWGTAVVIPWEAVYDYMPLNGEDWQFNVIRWSPVDGQTWGGKVHQPGRFNLLRFEPPTASQKLEIQKHMLVSSWEQFQLTAAELTAYWSTNPATAETNFYHYVIAPMIAEGEAGGEQLAQLGQLSAAQVQQLYEQNVLDWIELRYRADEQREIYLKRLLLGDNEPPTVTAATYSTVINTAVSGVADGSDPDGDRVMYSLGTAPAHGTASVEADGRWTYTPAADFTGTDQFTVIAADMFGATAEAVINLTVAPLPETAAALSPALPNGSNGWYTSDVTVTLEAPGGQAQIEYRIDEGDWMAYTEPVTITEEGVHQFEYRSVTGGQALAPKLQTIKIDKTAPLLTVTLDKTVLNPPNHKMVPIHATLHYEDGQSGIASVELVSVTSNEADNGKGDGNTNNDIQDVELGTEDTSFSLRAERAGGGQGRIYTVTYKATDMAGLTTEASAIVTVPH